MSSELSTASAASTLTVSEYQRLAKRTMKPRRTLAEDLSDYLLGLVGEAGELANEIKKMLYHNHPWDDTLIMKEAGDTLWYLAVILERLNIPLETTAAYNIEKLKQRYPEGYSDERSRHRAPTSGVVSQKEQLGNSDSVGDSNSVDSGSDNMEELLRKIEQRGYTWRLFSPPFNSYGYVHNRDKYPDITKYELIVWDSEHSHREFYGDTPRAVVERAAKALCPSLKGRTSVVRRSWQEFRQCGLLWWLNMILHTFGWAIVVEVDTDTGEIVDAFPGRVTFRGFPEKDNTEGYAAVTRYLHGASRELLRETTEGGGTGERT